MTTPEIRRTWKSVRLYDGKYFLCTWETSWFGTLESTLMVSIEPWDGTPIPAQDYSR